MVGSPNRLSAALALSRFGLGARQGDIDAIASDPHGALKDEIAARLIPAPQGDELKASPDLLKDYFAFIEMQRQQRERKAAAAASGSPMSGGQPATAPGAPAAPMPQSPPPDPSASMAKPGPGAPMSDSAAAQAQPKAEPTKPEIPLPQRVFLAEAKARFSGTVQVPRIGFGERLAMFWANHFAVSAAKSPNVRILAGAFEREAIRPHVFGRFSDMLIAVETHPAMLFYLDNQQSFGPDSIAGQRRNRGLNENLARETLELHTLGVDGGYSQADVTSLARIITGWTVVGREGRLGDPGSFTFFANAHEPGPETVLGRVYGDQGFEQGKAALLDLARHPATATHIARKLARHFVSDTPPASLVERLATVFRSTDGDLAALSTALIESDEAWALELVKLRSPLEFAIAMLRATEIRPEPQPVLGALYAMGQPLWQPAGPNGYADTADAWASPEALKTRMDIANAAALRTGDRFDPTDFVETRLGPMLSQDTKNAVSRAESRTQGLAIAFMSPEFQRR